MTHDDHLWFHIGAPIVVAVLRRPRLWPTALRQFGRAVPAGWWRRPPFLPRPDAEFLRFRAETAFGRRGTPTPADLTRYLEWCRATDRARADAARAGSARR
jgi:hypothetical protein